MNGKRLVYLDSASSSQKPQAVLDAMDEQYRNYYANIHRGVYTIAEESTAKYELARAKIARFLGAAQPNEVVFTKNITEAINLFAYSWGRTNLAKATRSSSPRWSTTPTSSRGTSCAPSAASSCAGCRSTTTSVST